MVPDLKKLHNPRDAEVGDLVWYVADDGRHVGYVLGTERVTRRAPFPRLRVTAGAAWRWVSRGALVATWRRATRCAG